MNYTVPVLLCCLWLLAACKKEVQPTASSRPRPVKVTRVEALGSITRQYTGVVESRESSMLAFKVPGTLTELHIQEGQHVKKGTVIARIKPYDYRLQYETAEANYKAAQSIYERNQRLLTSDAIARQNAEIAEADYVRASSALNMARSTLGYTTLTAPFDGIIEKRYADNFEEVGAGQSIARLVNPDSIEIRFILPETSIRLLELPKKIYVEFDSQKGKLFASEIQEYIYSSDGSGIPVTLNITDREFAPYRKNVFPGFSCKVIWETGNRIADKFIIPSSALVTRNDKHYVWLVDPATLSVRLREISIRPVENHILVLDGLSSQDLIVTAGASSLKEGQQVKL